MATRTYIDRNFQGKSLSIIRQANAICAAYQAQGLDLTLRQLYYQFVARGIIPNKDTEYKRLGSIINDARLAGYLDWDYIVDRTRNVREEPHWDSPAGVIRAAARSYNEDKWAAQETYVECLHPDELITTRQGLRPIGSVAVGDLVLTHTGQWKPITKVIRNRYAGMLATIKAAGTLPVRITANHPVLADVWDQSRPGYKGSKRKFLQQQFVAAGKLGKFDLVHLPSVQAVKDVEPVLLASKRGHSFTMQWDAATQAMIGLYLAEGRVREDGRTIQFTVGTHEATHIEAIEKWALNAGLTCTVTPEGGATQVYVYSKALCGWLKEAFGSGAFNKSLPAWFMEAPKDGQLECVRWYFRGDGGVDETTSCYSATSRSRALVEQVRMVLVRCGYLACVAEVPDHGAPRYEVTLAGASGAELAERWGVALPVLGLGRSKRYNHLRLTEAGIASPIRQVSLEHYQGEVINLEVEEDHTYVTSFVVHNCWVEKDALIGVLDSVCPQNDVPYFSCRGYTSQSEVWSAAQRLGRKIEAGKRVTIIHLGDHDPSGIDMSRDIEDRLRMFIASDVFQIDYEGLDQQNINWEAGDATEEHLAINRIALNMDQVRQYNPPPNPAKLTDSRVASYISNYGRESWELDALEPTVLVALIQNAIDAEKDPDVWDESVSKQEAARVNLTKASQHWAEVNAFIEGIAS